MFDEVLGIHVSRSEFEKRAKFNSGQKPTQSGFSGSVSDNDETVRFPSRPKQELRHDDERIDNRLVCITQSKYKLRKHT